MLQVESPCFTEKLHYILHYILLLDCQYSCKNDRHNNKDDQEETELHSAYKPKNNAILKVLCVSDYVFFFVYSKESQ